MSFNAKNLSYETNEPPFLQKLRNQYGDTSGRLERPIARPRKPKDDNDDDEPTYVDEENNEVISKEDYEALVRESNQKENTQTTGDPDEKEKTAPSTETGGEANAEKEPPTAKQNLAEIGGPRKRKQAKVVGEDNGPDNKQEPAEPAQPADGTASQKPKQKKKKKIKLSFDEA